MKKIQKQFSVAGLCILLAGVLIICAWKNPHENNYSGRIFRNADQMDTVPVNNNHNNNSNTNDLDKAMKDLDINMANLNVQMKDLK